VSIPGRAARPAAAWILLGLAGCSDGDITADRDCANNPVVIEPSHRTPLGFSPEEAVAAATRSWRAVATLLDAQRQPAGTTELQIAVGAGEGPARYQDPEVYQNSRHDRPRTCPEVVSAPVTLSITSADGRIALAETAEIRVARLTAIAISQSWLLPSSPDPTLLRYPPLRGRIAFPPELAAGDTATALNAEIDVTAGSGGLGLFGVQRLPDALSAGPGKPLVRW
jgi:hypothetical protein